MPRGGLEYTSTLSLTSALYGSEWSMPRPGRFTPGKKTRHPLYGRLGEPQGRSGRVRNVSTAPECDTRTVQPIGRRYTDWAIPVHIKTVVRTSNFVSNTISPPSKAPWLGTVPSSKRHTNLMPGYILIVGNKKAIPELQVLSFAYRSYSSFQIWVQLSLYPCSVQDPECLTVVSLSTRRSSSTCHKDHNCCFLKPLI
jgi:hypothetical protein